MWYLVIGLAGGLVLDRYVFPIFDMFLEMLQYKITNKCTSIQIDTNLKSLEYEAIISKGNELAPAIGFLAGHDYSEIEEEHDDDEQDNMKIGFIK